MSITRLQPVIRFAHRVAGADAAKALTDGHLLARFARDGDEDAFTALVRRHGPMVLGLCRRVLGDCHDAEDAFQATFLLLARKGGSLARPERLGNWLHGVATRTAAKARVRAARRRAREGRAVPAPAAAPDDDLIWRDLRPVLDEEIGRLPTRYRVPVVMCYLEGQTNEAVARHLGCSRGTVATRLARARERLRRRLTTRGLAPCVTLTAAWVAQSARAAGLSPVLSRSTVEAASLFAAGGVRAAGALPAPVALLVKGILVDMVLQKVKLAAILLLTAGVFLAGAAGLAARRAAGQGADQPGATPPPPVVEAVPPPAVAPQPGEVGETSVTHRTANFEVAGPNKGVARKVALAAEARRKSLAKAWLGREMPTWDRRCPVRVTLGEGVQSSSTSFQFDGGKVVGQEMRLGGTLGQILDDLLPHEVTHTVLAHRFGRGIPRWADEGAALLAEGGASRKRHERLLGTILDGKRGIPLPLLLPMREYPRDVMALYTQGGSLTAFLIRAGGREKFLAFVEQGEGKSWKKAVEAHYGYPTVAALEEAWLAGVEKARRKRAKAPADPAAASARDWHDRPNLGKGGVELDGAAARQAGESLADRLPAGPAPGQALVTLGKDGRLTVWRVRAAYRPTTSIGKDGRPITTYAPVRLLRAETHLLEDVKVYDTRGKLVSGENVRKSLKGETPALITEEGRPIDPLHLRLIKEGTLTFALPPAPPAPASVAPPAPVVSPRGAARPGVPPARR